MVKGVFEKNVPFIQIDLAWGDAMQSPFVVLDTGFTGDVQVTPKIADELGLQTIGVIDTQLANGQIIEMPTALAVAGMEGMARYVEVLIADSMPLAGISFLSKFSYQAVLDCKYKTVALERIS